MCSISAGIPEVTARLPAKSWLEYCDLLMNAPIGILSFTSGGQVLYANTALARMLRYSSSGELIDAISDVYSLICASSGQGDDLRLLLERDGEVANYECKMTRRDDTELWVSISARAVRNENRDLFQYQGYVLDVTSQKQKEKGSSRIERMLSGDTSSAPLLSEESFDLLPDYGDLTLLNREKTILEGVGKNVLADIVADFLDLLDTSVAVYEKNGDYALGIFSSTWCRFLDRAARRLCATEDNQAALTCGKWLCHESCWEMAREAIQSGHVVDRECIGGIRIYAVPIRTEEEVIGSINIGYGDPPRNRTKLQELAATYHVDIQDLSTCAFDYESRPHFIIDLAKKRTQAAARLIGEIVQRKQAEQKLQKTLEEYETVFQSTQEAMFLVEVVQGTEFRYIRNNRAHQRLTGFYSQNFRGKTPHELLDQELGNIVASNYRSCVQASCPISYEETLDLPAGRRTWHTNLTPVFQEGRIAFIVGSCRDITQRKALEEDLLRRTEEQAVLLDCVPTQLWYLIDPDTYGAVNQAHADFLGLPKEEVQIQRIEKVATHDEAQTCRRGNLFVYSTRKKLFTEEWVYNSEGVQRLLAITKTPKLDAVGNVEYVVCTATDITEQKEYEQQLQYLTLHDQLTGLYNRAFLEAELDRLGKGREFPITIVCMDLDGLKLVNDTLGHDQGDEHLRLCANILRTSFRASDILARVGGDEFVALLPTTDLEAGEKIVSRIRSSLDSFNLEHRAKIPVGLSIGLACAEEDDPDLNQVYKQADDLMYRDKLNRDINARSQVMKALMAALEERDFITSGHAHRLEDLCVRLGRQVNLSFKQLSDLNLLAHVHDLGKVGIPDHILFKPGPLNDQEWEIMQQHPEKGYRIALSTNDLAGIADLILKHHERWDGKGYPLGLAGEDIPIECRILAIVDSFDAMTNDRPYRKAISVEQALKELMQWAATQFDPDLVDLFVHMMSGKAEKPDA